MRAWGNCKAGTGGIRHTKCCKTGMGVDLLALERLLRELLTPLEVAMGMITYAAKMALGFAVLRGGGRVVDKVQTAQTRPSPNFRARAAGLETKPAHKLHPQTHQH